MDDAMEKILHMKKEMLIQAFGLWVLIVNKKDKPGINLQTPEEIHNFSVLSLKVYNQ